MRGSTPGVLRNGFPGAGDPSAGFNRRILPSGLVMSCAVGPSNCSPVVK